MIEVKPYGDLTIDELYSILKLRAEVFVVEQNCPYQDLDGNDVRSVHVFEKDHSGNVVSCLRVFLKEDGNATIGRVVTSLAVRGTGAGKRLVMTGIEAARRLYPCRQCVIHAQSYAIGFYEKCGFVVSSGEFLEDGIPHVEMKLQL